MATTDEGFELIDPEFDQAVCRYCGKHLSLEDAQVMSVEGFLSCKACYLSNLDATDIEPSWKACAKQLFWKLAEAWIRQQLGIPDKK